MPRPPQVRVRDKETGHEYFVSEARFRRTPKLWERLDQGKPRTTVKKAAAKKTAAKKTSASPRAAKKTASGQPAADPSNEES